LSPSAKAPDFDRHALTDLLGAEQTVKIINPDNWLPAESQQQIAVFEPTACRRTVFLGANNAHGSPFLDFSMAAQALRDTDGLCDDS
jgi:hypothetical protein